MEQGASKETLFKVLSLLILVIVVLLVYSVFWGPAKKYGDSLWSARTINVSAEGKITVEPDLAIFSFSVVSEGVDPEKIAEQNNMKVKNAVEFVKTQGIEEKDIKTTEYNLYPKYTYDETTKKSFIYGYELTQTVSVKVRNLKENLGKVTKIIGGLPEVGINRISSISFQVEEPENYLKEVRAKAFEKAKDKAEAMAEANGLRLGRIMNVSEYGAPGPFFDEMGGAEGAMLKSAVLPPIEPGSQEISVNVNITYAIK